MALIIAIIGIVMMLVNIKNRQGKTFQNGKWMAIGGIVIWLTASIVMAAIGGNTDQGSGNTTQVQDQTDPLKQ